MAEFELCWEKGFKTSNNIRLMCLQEMSLIYLAPVVIYDGTDTSTHWTLKPQKDLVWNVWNAVPDMPKITPKADTYLIPRPDTHLISLPTTYLHIAI